MGSLEVMLFAGLAIQAGWADGLTHSPASKIECAMLIEKLPAYARGPAKCIVKIDPNTKKPLTRARPSWSPGYSLPGIESCKASNLSVGPFQYRLCNGIRAVRLAWYGVFSLSVGLA
jgi:hypothetical protein